MPEFDGSLARSALAATNPPAEAPIATTGTDDACVKAGFREEDSVTLRDRAAGLELGKAHPPPNEPKACSAKISCGSPIYHEQRQTPDAGCERLADSLRRTRRRRGLPSPYTAPNIQQVCAHRHGHTDVTLIVSCRHNGFPKIAAENFEMPEKVP
jgi:hypothetical protein